MIRKYLVFHSTKGGVGTSLLTAHAIVRARARGLHVAALAFDPTHDLRQWCERLGIACADGLADEDVPDDAELVIVDVNTQIEDIPLDADLWVIPIDCRMSIDHALSLSDRLHGRIVWLENHPFVHHVIPKLTLPRYLSHVEVLAGWRGIPRSQAIREASLERRIVWSDEDGAKSAGGRAMEAAIDRLIDKVMADEDPITLPLAEPVPVPVAETNPPCAP